MEQTKTFENNGQLVCFTNNYALIITGDCLRVVSPKNPYITIEGKHVRAVALGMGAAKKSDVFKEMNEIIEGQKSEIESAKFEGKTAAEWATIAGGMEKEISELWAYIKETRDSKISMLGPTLEEWVKKNEQNQSIISQQSQLIQQQAAELDGLRSEVMELKGR